MTIKFTCVVVPV